VDLLGILIAYPILAAAPALAFLALYWHARRRLLLLVAGAWLLYGLYEYGMKRRILCSGECNIRVDLLLIYPALLAASLAGVLAYATWLRRRPR
jgi:hypothetical protein